MFYCMTLTRDLTAFIAAPFYLVLDLNAAGEGSFHEMLSTCGRQPFQSDYV